MRRNDKFLAFLPPGPRQKNKLANIPLLRFKRTSLGDKLRVNSGLHERPTDTQARSDLKWSEPKVEMLLLI